MVKNNLSSPTPLYVFRGNFKKSYKEKASCKKASTKWPPQNSSPLKRPPPKKTTKCENSHMFQIAGTNAKTATCLNQSMAVFAPVQLSRGNLIKSVPCVPLRVVLKLFSAATAAQEAHLSLCPFVCPFVPKMCFQ